MIHASLTERVIGLAMGVHRDTCPGLLESVYERCLCHELHQAGIPFERQAAVPVVYKGLRLDEGFRSDIVVDHAVILEIKAVAKILQVHEAQLHTYLRMSGIRVGLILNFNAGRLIDGLRQLVVWPGPPSVALRGSRPSSW
jgi:GxxExxY protein